MRLLHVVTLSAALLIPALCAPPGLEAQTELQARPAPAGRGPTGVLTAAVRLHVAGLVEARERYGAHANTLFEARISPGSEAVDSRIAGEICRELEADAAALERHAVSLSGASPRELDRWLAPLAERARESRAAAAGLRGRLEARIPLEEKQAALEEARGLLRASGEMGLLLAGLKQDLGVTTRTSR